MYREGDGDDLRRRFRELHDEPGRDGAGLAEYVQLFSREQVTAAVSRAVLGHGAGARLPAIELAGGADAAAVGSMSAAATTRAAAA